MKLVIKGEGHRLYLFLPNSLFFSPAAYHFLRRTAKKYGEVDLPEISKETLKSLKRALGSLKKCQRPYNLLEVQSADGDVVLIRP